MQTAHDTAATVVIDPEGDIVLQVSDQEYPTLTAAYRVSAAKLKHASAYFTNLLSPKFKEGSDLEAQLQRLSLKYGDHKDVPEPELPIISIENIGRIGKVKHFRSLVTDFLRILHGLGIINGTISVPIANLANLAIVADRFDALDILKAYTKKHNVFAGTQRRKSVAPVEAFNEERTRMRLIVAVLLEHPPWFPETLSLILKGSPQWRDAKQDVMNQALWWDLPRGVEEELQYRRNALISSLSMLLSYFLSVYSSGDLQCKMGYSNSLNCDLFQLGQTVKFYNRLGLLHLESTMAGMEGRDPFDGDIQKALDVLRQCPNYQIDKFHAHCGLRDRLTRVLEVIQATLADVGICGECWETDRPKVCWRDMKRPATATLHAPDKTPRYHRGHAQTSDFYLANDKNWNDSR